jgi:hydroxyacylglutathione hydrolase
MRSTYCSCSILKRTVPFAIFSFVFLGVLFNSGSAWSQMAPGSMDVHWDEGAANCASQARPPLQVHAYNGQTFILRENLCATFEAPFMYLLIGSSKALLIDTGDIADPTKMPLAETVMKLIRSEGSDKLPLVVVHTHRHLDHRAGDAQFARLPNVEVVGFDLDSVRRFYGFSDWPNGITEIELGNRSIDAIPTPGHNETEVSFYDQDTGLVFSGDFLLPARLLVDDTKAYVASADRLATFVRDRPVSFVLGGHIEKDVSGQTFPWQSQSHSHERVLQMSKADVLALPAAMRKFNGFYTTNGNFLMMNSIHILIAFAVAVALALIAVGWALVRYVRRRRRTRHGGQQGSLAV